jgi:hypothetical protein
MKLNSAFVAAAGCCYAQLKPEELLMELIWFWCY